MEAVTLRLHALLNQRPTLLIGVARNQMLIEGSPPTRRTRCSATSRTGCIAINWERSSSPKARLRAEIADVMRTLSSDSRTEPLGNQSLEDLQRWPHIRLFPQAYDQLELTEDGAAKLGKSHSPASLAGPPLAGPRLGGTDARER